MLILITNSQNWKDVGSDNKFSKLKGTGKLTSKIVHTKKDKLYSLIYLSITLVLILPIVTTTVEMAFLAMNFVKNHLWNRMRGEWLRDIIVVYIEKGLFCILDDEVILQHF